MENIISINDRGYPRLLAEIQDPPEKLYYKGTWNESIFERCLAVVGSRKMSSYGKRIAQKIVSEISFAGITIVSGFMYGIDATSHKAALEADGRTIAVMPCGIDIIHPGYQKELYEEILDSGGLIISEFEADHPPAVWTYPRRNRIVAGLSHATLVVEAGAKSGSLITAELAKEYERELFAVPGLVTSSLSEGTLQLIKEGACMATGAQEIIKYYRERFPKICISEGCEKGKSVLTEESDMTGTEKLILEHLKVEPMEIDHLSRSTGISSPQMGTILSLMHIKGFVYKEEAKYYVK